MPRVSVIIPCYNQAKFLPETLQSIINQSYEDWECLVVNDGSNDATANIGRYWADKDCRFRYIEQKNSGRSSARNKGLQMAKGEYIQFLDGDDLLLKDKLALSIEEFNADKSTSLVISNFKVLNSTTGKFEDPFCELKPEFFNFRSMLLESGKCFSIPIHCPLIKKKLLDDFSFNEELEADEDFIMWLKIFNKNPKCVYLYDQLAVYRFHPKNTFRNNLHMSENARKAYKYIFENILSDEDKSFFFNRTLERWENESKIAQNLQNSTSFKIGNKVVNFLNIFYKRK